MKQHFELTPDKKAYLEQRLKRKSKDTGHQRPTITKRAKNTPCIVSFSQERLWFLDQLEPNTSTYNITSAFRLTGPLNILALEQSLNTLVQRHEALRTTFDVADDQPVQIITPALNIPLQIHDMQPLPPLERERETQRLTNRERQRPFDLAKWPALSDNPIKNWANKIIF